LVDVAGRPVGVVDQAVLVRVAEDRLEGDDHRAVGLFDPPLAVHVGDIEVGSDLAAAGLVDDRDRSAVVEKRDRLRGVLVRPTHRRLLVSTRRRTPAMATRRPMSGSAMPDPYRLMVTLSPPPKPCISRNAWDWEKTWPRSPGIRYSSGWLPSPTRTSWPGLTGPPCWRTAMLRLSGVRGVRGRGAGCGPRRRPDATPSSSTRSAGSMSRSMRNWIAPIESMIWRASRSSRTWILGSSMASVTSSKADWTVRK